MVNAKDDDYYLDLEEETAGCKQISKQFIKRCDESGLRPLTPAECKQRDDESLDELLAPLYDLISDDEPTTEDTKPAIAETLKAEPTKAGALRTRQRKPVAEKLVKQAQPTEDDLADVVEELEDADLIAGISAFKEQLEGTDLAAASNNQLLQWVGEIREGVSCGEYSDEEQQRFILIGKTLIERQCGIVGKHHKAFPSVDCKRYPAMQRFSNDLQGLDLYQGWFHHHGHEVDDQACDGLFAGIYCGDVFDWGRVQRIAIGEYTDNKGKVKNLTPGMKVKHLRLSFQMQAENSVLCGAEVKNDTKNAKARQHRLDAKITAIIKVESVNIRHQLETYANQSMSRMKKIDDYANVWIALRLSGGNKSNLVGIMASYKKLTGEDINKPLVRVRLTYLEKAGILKRV